MDFMTIVSAVSCVVGLCAFFGWNSRHLRYLALRFAEYPEITMKTPPTAAIAFFVHSTLVMVFGLCGGLALVAMAVYVGSRPETPFRAIAIGEMVVASAVLLWGGYCAGSATTRTYRRFFPEAMLDEQLHRRGFAIPDELKERRDAR
jgi:hypothetical protein